MSKEAISAYKKAIKVSKKAADVIVEEMNNLECDDIDKGVVFTAAMAQLAGRMILAIEKTYGVPYDILIQGIKVEYDASKENMQSFTIGLN